MCKSCNAMSWNNRFEFAERLNLEGIVTAFQLASSGLAGLQADKLTTAFPTDGVGDVKPEGGETVLVAALSDEAGDGIGAAPGNPALTVGAPSFIGVLNPLGDQDFFTVTLEAGKTYEIGMYSYAGTDGPSGVPLFDPYVELYDAAGNLIVTADGGAHTLYNEFNSGFDVLLTFEAKVSGTFYVNARAYDNFGGTATGDSVGDYELFVREQDPNDPNLYNPYYEPESPLYSIDWGTQVDGTARNPDGNEGARATGNAQGTPDNKGEDVGHFGQSTEGKNVIKIYFAKAGDVYTPNNPLDPGLPPAIVAVGAKDYEIAAVWTSLREFEKVADIVYVETQNRDEADFHYVTYSGTPGPGISLLGSMSPPQESDEGLAQFNSGDYRWNATNLQQGGFSFVTLIHEFGHGHGLAHPHDGGGRSGEMRGVEGVINTPAGPVEDPTGVWPNYTLGDYNLNQGVFTMMSYQDGWQTSPYGNAATNVGYGYLGGLMAFDIAAIQDKYGVNEEWATGDDVYTLKDVNAAGTFYSSIWDAAGIDEIRYEGTRNTTIDLRAATLEYEAGGGGWVSYAYGIYGGFTIANGAVIENATSGDGNDTLTGNAADNRLTSGAGNDVVRIDGGGNDVVDGGSGSDSIYAGAAFTAADSIDAGDGRDALLLQGDYSGGVTLGTGTTSNIAGLESISLFSGANTSYGDTAGNSYSYRLTSLDANLAAGAMMKVNGAHLLAGEDFTFDGSDELDGKFWLYGGLGVEDLTGGAQGDTFIFAHDGRFGSGDAVDGGGGYDVLYLRGDYVIDFNAAGFAGSLTNVESIGLLSATESLYASGGDGEFDYSLTWNNGMLAAGASMTVNGSRLTASEGMAFNGAAESDGRFSLFGGAGGDTLTAGGGNDLIFGGGGIDRLRGNGGSDTFRYDATTDSGRTTYDTILDFAHGEDRIDLSRMDANSVASGNQSFTFIGSGAFTAQGAASAGQLRATEINSAMNMWRIEADVNGDGAADLIIHAIVQAGEPLTQTDFVL